MMHTDQALYDALRQNLAEVELQIKHIKNDIALQYPEDKRDKLNVWYWMRKVDGQYVLEDMILAKSNILAGMAALKAASMVKQAPVVRNKR